MRWSAARRNLEQLDAEVEGLSSSRTNNFFMELKHLIIAVIVETPKRAQDDAKTAHPQPK
jgi:hypothetical protein